MLPFAIDDGHLEVAAAINDRPARLWFDTGAATMTIAEGSLGRLGIDTTPGRGFISGIGGARSLSFSQGDRITIGRFHSNDFAFVVADIFQTLRDPPDGLMGMDVLSRADIDLDLPAHEIDIYRQGGDCGAAPVALSGGSLAAVPLLSGDDESPRIPVTIGGVRLSALIDTGSPASMIFRDAAQRVAASGVLQAGTHPSVARGVGPDAVRGQEDCAADVHIGDGLEVRNMRLAALDQAASNEVDMILGLSFLRRVHVWISHRAHLVVLQYPPLPSLSPKG